MMVRFGLFYRRWLYCARSHDSLAIGLDRSRSQRRTRLIASDFNNVVP